MSAVAYLLGLLLAGFGATYLLPVVCSVLTGDGLALRFLFAGAVNSAAGALLAASTQRTRRDLKPRDGFLLVTLAWILVSAFSTLPLLLAMPGLGFSSAFFETMSGLTTTGSTVLVGLDRLPPSVNLWRHELQWIGGLGIIVMAVAVLPVLGIGGMQLYRGDTPGPIKNERLAPRIIDATRSLWLVYAALTVLGIAGLRICGMSWLDAVCHAFSAVSLGGFSTHDASVGFFHSPAIELVLIALMLVAALNFARHFLALRQLSLQPYAVDPECRAIFAILGLSVLGIASLLQWQGSYPDFLSALRHAAFNVISVATTTGYSTQDYTHWPEFAPLWMLFLACILCSTGNAGGGIRMFRTLLLSRQAGRELKLLVHPSAVAPVRIGGRPVPDRVGDAVLGFIFLYFMTVALFTFALLLTGLDFETAMSASVAAITNTAHGLGQVGPMRSYHALSTAQAWLCAGAMLMGRLEIFSVIVLFTRAFWRK